MSILRPTPVACPVCATTVTFDLVHSVNAGRRPDLREAVLDGSFQCRTCTACGHAFRIEPEFTYTDLERGQFLAVWPSERAGDWPACEARSRDAFEQAFGSQAPAPAREMGAALHPRIVFGWPALEEKLRLADEGLDDATVEMAKVAVLRHLDALPLGAGHEFRLVGRTDEHLVFGWSSQGGSVPGGEVEVPRTLLADIDDAPDAWNELRGRVAGGLFVDYRRCLLG